MSKHPFKSIFILAVAVLTIFAACKKEDTAALTTEEYVDQALFIIQEEGNIGPFGCYELVFPVSFELPDGTILTVESYDELATAFEAWHNDHEGDHRRGDRPQFVFPFEIMTEEGELVTVENRDQLHRLREACGSEEFGRRDHRGHRGNCQPCFEIVFPLTILFPDDTTLEVADRQELKQAIRQWKQDNPGVDERPEIVFPITVVMEETGEVVTVNSREELHDLRESCQD